MAGQRRSPGRPSMGVTATALWTLLVMSGSSIAGAIPAAQYLQPTPTATPASSDAAVHARQAQPTIAYVDGYRALGCFEDSGILTVTSRINSGMSPSNCRNWCSVNSAPIFGVKNGMHCFCGTIIEPFAQKAPEDECTRACFGASSLLCGASGRLNMYAPTDYDVGTFADSAPTVTGPADSTDAAPTSGASSGTTAPPSSAAESGDDDDGDEDSFTAAPGGANLPAATIVGIAVGAAALSGVITAVVMCCFCRRRRHGPEKPVEYRPRPSQSMVYAAGTSMPSPPPPPPPPVRSPVPQPQYGRHELSAQHPPKAYEMPTAQR